MKKGFKAKPNKFQASEIAEGEFVKKGYKKPRGNLKGGKKKS